MLPNTLQLLDIMAKLRHPETGCAWDLKQDFASLIPYLIEEAYEVIDAIERDNIDDLRSELGDLLLQVVFHARLAEEQQLFNFDDVAGEISEKLIRRHPHVFAGVTFDNDEQCQQAWEQAKANERQAKIPETTVTSILDDIPGSLPALMQCEKILTRVARHGFDWPTIEPVFAKVQEEIAEVREAIALGDQTHIEEEIGDLLLVVVNLARHLNVNAEWALKQSNKKFSKRFNYIEQQVQASGKVLTECSLAELDGYWDEAKIALKQQMSE